MTVALLLLPDFLLICGGAWLSLLIAAVWSTLLGIGARRRAAAAELKRRTDRALSGIGRHSPTSGTSGAIGPQSGSPPRDRGLAP